MKELIKKFIPNWLLNSYHFILAFLGALIYGFPSRKIKVIGVTGTNGKTTTTEMIGKIFEETEYKVALLNSIHFKIGQKEWKNELRVTMPGRFFIQRFLKKAVNESCKFAVLEITSEGIKQHRHKFIDFEAVVFTNLSPEHIEAHGSFEKYREAKGELFKITKNIHVINLDDENANYFLKFPATKKFGFAKGKDSKIPLLRKSGIEILSAEGIKSNSKSLSFKINNLDFNLNLLGKFNIYNALAAICVGISQGIDLETCQRALGKIKEIPGRMEEVVSKPFKVFIDYALTPNALEKVYQTLTTNYKLQTTKLICVLGSCGGGRDKWKRPVLGQIAGKYCDEVIVTNEDPYDENPMEIIEQVAKGAEKISINQPNQYKSAVQKILDRRVAIKEALRLAKENDVVIITGKGCESSICLVGGKKIPWDDRQVVREEFEKLKKL